MVRYVKSDFSNASKNDWHDRKTAHNRENKKMDDIMLLKVLSQLLDA